MRYKKLPMILREMIHLSLVLFLGLILVTSCHAQQDKNMDSGPKAPDFALQNIYGKTIHLSDFKGKVVLLNFFGTYCPPCRMEIPGFVALEKKYGPKGFQVIGVSVDQNPMMVLPRFIQAFNINYPVLAATNKVLQDYGNIYAIPVSVLISKDQRVIKRYVGMVSEKTLEPLIVKALQEQ